MSSINSNNATLLKALEKTIKPLVRLMLGRGITYTQFADWLKPLFVDVAIKDYSLEDKEMTDSRISILTGIHRKDVRRLRAESDESPLDTIPNNVNLGSQLVSTWLSTPEFLDGNAAKKIPRLKKIGGDISFENLAKQVTKDVSARALLEELERLGAITIDDHDMVSLVTEAFIPAKGDEEKTFYFGLGVGDHANAAVNNVLGHEPAHFDRLVHFNHFTDENIKQIETLSREHAGKLLQLINAESNKLSAQDKKTSNSVMKRFSLGVYFYSEDEDIEKDV